MTSPRPSDSPEVFDRKITGLPSDTSRKGERSFNTDGKVNPKKKKKDSEINIDFAYRGTEHNYK